MDGFFRLFYGDMCKECPRNFYCPPDPPGDFDVRPCRENSITHGEGKTKPSNCICMVGIMLTEESPVVKCFLCENNTRCSMSDNVTECFGGEIPKYDSSACVCPLGFGRNGLVCEECATGTYRDSNMTDHCVSCESGKARTSTTLCEDCTPHSDPSLDHSECLCRPPRVMEDGECLLCLDGLYYEAADPGCRACPAHSAIPPATGTTDALYDVSLCQCVPGYVRGDPEHCVSCGPGTYEAGGACVPCGQDAHSGSAAASQSQCYCDETRCHRKVWGADCIGGCEAPPDECEPCTLGHFKETMSDEGNAAPNCVMCGAAKFQDETQASSCKSCHVTRTHALEGRVSDASCECKPGFQAASGQECAPCDAGAAKSSVGNQVCTLCAEGDFSDVSGSLHCKSCGTESPIPGATATHGTGSAHVDECTCEMGLSLDAASSECAPCPTGSFKDLVGFQACTLCGANTDLLLNRHGDSAVAVTSISHCVPCPLNSGQAASSISVLSLMASVDDCRCMGGFHMFSAIAGCIQCPPYEYKTGFSAEECRLCDAGDYFTASFQTCARCHLYSVGSTLDPDLHNGLVINSADAAHLWGVNADDCACSLGWYRHNNVCHECEPGFFRADRAASTCTRCGPRLFQPERGTTSCEPCPDNSDTYAEVSVAVTACKCRAGFEWHPDTQTCAECGVGEFNADVDSVCSPCPSGFYADSPGHTECQACAQNELSEMPRDSESTCLCSPGFGADNSVCAVCVEGTYSAGGVSGIQRPVCQSCPTNKNTIDTGSTVVAACLCVPGYGDASSNADETSGCTICSIGTYAPGSANIPCQSCGYGAITDPEEGALSFDMCLCDAASGLRTRPAL